MKSANGSILAFAMSSLFLFAGLVFHPDIGGSTLGGGAQSVSYIPFDGSIFIDSEDDFTSENGVVSGSGTADDPYIIEGWSFDSSTIDVKISRTSSHLIIRNVAISNGVDSGQYGILIDNADNVEVRNCVIDWSGGGIQLFGPCLNISVEGNKIENNTGCGIYMIGKFEAARIMENRITSNRIDGLYGAYLSGASIEISNNTCSDNYAFGMDLVDDVCVNLTGNRISRNGNGGILAEGCNSPGVAFRRNVIEDHEFYGMELQGVTRISITDNTIERSGNIGIYLGSGSARCDIFWNQLSENGEGIVLGNVNNNTVQDNQIERSDYGIDCYGGWNRILSNSISTCRSAGINFFGTNGNLIRGNKISDSTVGILLYECNDEEVRNNTFLVDGATGLRVYRSEEITIVGNDFPVTGLTLSIDDSNDAIVQTNRFLSKDSGMEFIQTTDVVVYDNWFADPVRIVGPEGASWSLSERIQGKNIIGGQFLQGNYWANYDGEDIDGDGIGDTSLPFGPGDFGPLVMDPPPPDITAPNVSLVNGQDLPVTGEDHTFVFNVTDDRILFKTGVKMDWYQSNENGVIEDSLGHAEFQVGGSGVFTIIDSIADEAKWVLLVSNAIDFAGNGRSQLFNVSVLDNIAPALLSYSYDEEARTGENFSIVVHTRDNIGVQRAYALYGFGNATEVFLEAEGMRSAEWRDGYDVSIPIDLGADELFFELVSVDGSSNWIGSGIIKVPVTDTIPPEAEDVSIGHPQTGKDFDLKFLLEDNIGVASAELFVGFDGTDGRTYEPVDPVPALWTTVVHIGESSRVLEYHLTVKDSSGQEFALDGEYEVEDATDPTISFISEGVPVTGETFELRFETRDNYDLRYGYVKCWYEGWGPLIQEGIPLTLALKIPEDAYVLNVEGFVSDPAGNDAVCTVVLNVTDGTPPTIVIRTGEAETSFDLNVSVEAWDNRGINRSWVQYSIDGNTTVTDVSELAIYIPENATEIVIVAVSQDISGLVSSVTRNLDVSDGTPPRIISHSADRIGGGRVRFRLEATDNRGLSEALLYIGDGGPMHLFMDEGEFALVLDEDGLHTGDRYYFEVTDEAGNSATTEDEVLDLEGAFPWAVFAFIVPALLLVAIGIAVLVVRGRRAVWAEE